MDPIAVSRLFDRLAPGYDKQSLRFFPFSADRMVELLRPRPGSRILDIATGTGAAAVALAHAVAPGGGRVTGIDLSEGMLKRAIENARRLGVDNLDWFDMDASELEFKSDHFDAAVCAFALFFLPDMAHALQSWKRVVKPGAKVMFTCFGPTAFTPMVGMLREGIVAEGYAIPESAPMINSRHLADPENCRALMEAVGFEEVEVVTEQLGFHLAEEGDWWEVVENSGFRALWELLPRPLREDFRTRHLTEVAKLKGDYGIWLDVQVHFVAGIKPQA